MQRTGLFAPLLASSLAPLTHSLPPHCSLRSRAPVRSFFFPLAHLHTAELMGKRLSSMSWMRRSHILYPYIVCCHKNILRHHRETNERGCGCSTQISCKQKKGKTVKKGQKYKRLILSRRSSGKYFGRIWRS